jgi:nucleotidyltransferase/DNA polymerase involved in DNA repair
LPLSLLPLERERYEQLEELGVRRIGQLAGLPGGAVAERLGPDGRRAWSLARGEDENGGVNPRRPVERIAERLEFPEAVANELTLRRGLGVLVERVLGREERAGRPPRKLALTGRLVSGASWQRTLTLREPTAELSRLRAALAPKLAELPAPVTSLRLELVELAESVGHQLELVAEGAERATRLQDGLRQVRASVGVGGVSTVVEVSPWSRIPEARALLVPRDD